MGFYYSGSDWSIFKNFQTTSLIKSNEDQFIKYEEVPLEELGRLDRYDFVLGFGMGLRMTAGQREQLQKAADKGTPVYIYAATNPENNICNLDSITKADITSYIGNGNKKNYRNMARYTPADRPEAFLRHSGRHCGGECFGCTFPLR